MDAEDSELFSFSFLSPFYLGKWKKGTGFSETHVYNILVVLNREIFSTVGKTGNFVLLVGSFGKLSAWISYRNCT